MRRILEPLRQNRPWLRHQHEVTIDFTQRIISTWRAHLSTHFHPAAVRARRPLHPYTPPTPPNPPHPAPRSVPKTAVLHPIALCAPGGVPFQLNKTASDATYVLETALVNVRGFGRGAAGAGLGGDAAEAAQFQADSWRLKPLHPPPLGARLKGVAKWLAPVRARTLKIAQKSIRRNTFAKVARLHDDTRVSILKLELSDFGQERAAALDVWGVLDISNMDTAELSYQFEDGVESIEVHSWGSILQPLGAPPPPLRSATVAREGCAVQVVRTSGNLLTDG